jgi:hypothetical protein
MARQQGSRSVESRPDQECIARRAYERFEARGRENGRDLDDWLEAERELTGMSTNATVGKPNDRIQTRRRS